MTMSWNDLLDGVHARRARIAEMEQEIRDAKTVFEATIAKQKAELKRLEAADSVDIQRLTIEALANVGTGASNTWGGVQLRRTLKLVVSDEELAIAALDGIHIDGKPLIKRTLDNRLALAFVQMRLREGFLVDGLEVCEDITVAILKHAEKSANPIAGA